MRTSSSLRLTIAASLFLVTAIPGTALASACCASSATFGIGHLAVWETWAVGLQLGHARSLGQWDRDGSFVSNESAYYDYSNGLTTAQPWAIVRLHDRVQLQGWIPFVVEDRRREEKGSGGAVSQVAGGLGDVGAAVRVEVVKIGEREGFPSFAVKAGALAPTGTRIDDTSGPLFAGTTGRGAWGGSLAVEAEYALAPWFVRLDAGVNGYLPFTRDDGARQQYGPSLQATLSAGREVVRDTLVAAISIGGEWEAPYRIDGSVQGSHAYQYTLAGSLSWTVATRWTLVGNVTNNVWPDGAGMNRDARVGFTFGVRHAHF